MYDNTFYQLESDEFDTDDIVTVYPRNPFDQDADNLFGLGNPKKRAAKKLAKAEKQIAKGHTKKAEKKLMKAERILSPYNALQVEATGIKQQLHPTAATNTQQNESMSTAAGQIGTAAGTPTIQPSQISGGGSGGGSDGGSMDTGYTPETNLATNTPENTTPSDEPTGDLAATKDLQGVVVTSTTQNKLLIFIVLGAVVLLSVWYFSKHKSLK